MGSAIARQIALVVRRQTLILKGFYDQIKAYCAIRHWHVVENAGRVGGAGLIL
jgi:hypothetical protein